MSDYNVRAVLEYSDKGFASGMKKAQSVLAGTESAAGSLGSRIKKGLGFGVLMGIGQKAVSTVSNAITNNLGSAVKRFDTLNNFPKVMDSMGYSTRSVSAALKTMDNGIAGLPTTMDGITQSTQMLTASLGDVKKGAKSAVALNDMFLAGGQGAEAASRALTQYNQMLAKGKVDQQSWNTLVEVAPGQMNQLAKSMLGAGKNQKDLYNALQSGKISMNDFNNAIIKLDEKGGKGFASFAEQARNSTQGIETSITNMKTGVVKGLATMLGKANKVMNISAGFKKLGDSIKSVMGRIAESKTFAKVLRGIANGIKGVVPIVKSFGSALGKVITAFVNTASTSNVLKSALKKVQSILIRGAYYLGDHANQIVKLTTVVAGLWVAFKGASAVNSAIGTFNRFSKVVGSFGVSGGAVAVAIAGTAALGAMVYRLATQYSKATNEAKKNAEAREQAVGAVDAENEYIDSLYRRLEELDGIEEKSTKQKEEMKNIVNQLNGAVDDLNIKYDEEKGHVEGGTDAIKKRIDAYKEQARTAALQDAMKQAYKEQYENEKKLAEAHEKVTAAEQRRNKTKQNGLKLQTAVSKAKRDYEEALKTEQDLLRANKAINKEISQIGKKMKIDTNAFDDLVAKAKKAGYDVPAELVASIKQGKQKVPTSIFELAKASSPAFAAAVNNAKKAGVSITDNIKQGIESGKLKPQEAIRQINALIDGEQKKSAPKSKANGASGTKNFASGLLSKLGTVFSNAKAVSKKGNEGLSAYNSSTHTSGSNFARGFYNGIGAWIRSVWSRAKELAKNAWAGLRKGQKEGSPSKLTTKSGRYFGQGYAIGIRKESKHVAKAARDLVNIPSLRSPQTNLAFAGSSTMHASVQYGYDDLKTDLLDALSSRPIITEPVVQIDGRVVARTTAVYMQDEQNKLQTRENRKMGVL